MHAKSLQLCPTLCDPMDSSPPGSSIHRILQARILEWVAISFSNACMHAKLLFVSDSVWSYGQQPTRLLCPQDSLGKNTGVGCHFLLPSVSYNRSNERNLESYIFLWKKLETHIAINEFHLKKKKKNRSALYSEPGINTRLCHQQGWESRENTVSESGFLQKCWQSHNYYGAGVGSLTCCISFPWRY